MMPLLAARQARPWADRALALAFGAVAAGGQAPLDLWPLALVGLAGLTWRVAVAKGTWAAAWIGWAGGTGYFAVALSWIVEPFFIDIARHGWMAPFALVLMAGGMALFWAAAAALAQLGRPVALAFAVTLTLAEVARGTLFTGFPWAMPGHIWISAPVGQAAAVVGAYGLTLLTMVAVALPVAFGLRGLAVSAVLVGGVWGYGAVQLTAPPPPDRAATVRLVQPNAEQGAKWDPSRARDFFLRQLSLTAEFADPVPALVIWPETSVPYLLDNAGDALRVIGEAGAGAQVAVGIQRTDGGSRGWNSLAVVAPDGEIAQVYDKYHLVPFGEYIPFGDLLYQWFGLRAFAAAEGFGYSAGEGPVLLDLGPVLGHVVPLICYEAVFPYIPRAAQAEGRADWLLQITNDAWFGKLSGPYQHLALARLRAIEQGLPLIRVANTGVSAVIDARGRILASMQLGVQGRLDAALPGALAPTPYARWGDWPVLVLLTLFAAGLVMVRSRART